MVIALALFADEDYEEVAARLAGTLADWDGWEEPWVRVRTSGRVAQARQRLDLEPMKAVLAGRQTGSDDGGGGGRSSDGGG